MHSNIDVEHTFKSEDCKSELCHRGFLSLLSLEFAVPLCNSLNRYISILLKLSLKSEYISLMQKRFFRMFRDLFVYCTKEKWNIFHAGYVLSLIPKINDTITKSWTLWSRNEPAMVCMVHSLQSVQLWVLFLSINLLIS